MRVATEVQDVGLSCLLPISSLHHRLLSTKPLPVPQKCMELGLNLKHIVKQVFLTLYTAVAHSKRRSLHLLRQTLRPPSPIGCEKQASRARHLL